MVIAKPEEWGTYGISTNTSVLSAAINAGEGGHAGAGDIDDAVDDGVGDVDAAGPELARQRLRQRPPREHARCEGAEIRGSPHRRRRPRRDQRRRARRPRRCRLQEQGQCLLREVEKAASVFIFIR